MTRNAEEIVNQGPVTHPTICASGNNARSPHVAILMALFNGAANLEDQLVSFLDQTHRNWSLVVSDDGSTDDGPSMVRRFGGRSSQSVTLVAGPRQGFAQNFLNLLCAAGPSVPFAALSDQDDVWLPCKLKRALKRLADLPEGVPALYTGRTIICDEDLRPLRRSPCFRLPPGFRNALVQNIGGGNTMVLNRAALDLVQETADHAVHIASHDWWIYQIVSGAGGQVIYDPEPSLLYRQHAGNVIGANDTQMARFLRLSQVVRGRYRSWNAANIAALDAASQWLTPGSRATLQAFIAARNGSLASRVRAFRASGVYRQTRCGNAALKAAALLNRI